MASRLIDNIIEGMILSENDLESPTFNWQGTDYVCIPLVNEVQRKLDFGGYAIDKLLSMTVRIVDLDRVPIFDTLPQPQQLITYDDQTFRILWVKKHPTKVYLTIKALGVTRGI